MPEEEKLAAVRTGLPATAAGIYLNTGSAGPLPAETANAMAEVTAVELATGRAHPEYLMDGVPRIDEARAAIAAIAGTTLDQVALTHASTDGMNLATLSADWRPGDLAVTSTQEHPGGLGPLYAMRERFGVQLAFVDPDPDGDDDRTVAAFDAAIRPDTRLVSISHVLWTTGALMPVRRIAALAHERGAIVVVDGAQAMGAIPVVVGETGADLYAMSGQKWLLGPDGMGALWCSPAALDRVHWMLAGWFTFAEIDGTGTAVVQPDARRFQVSNYHRPSVVGLARSCGWLSMFVGLDWVHQRGTALARRTRDLLAAIPGIEVLTPADRMGTLVTFRIAGWNAEAALAELGARAFVIARSIPPLDAIRVSVAFFNTEDEIDQLVDCVGLLAAHTPDALPPRRRLTIVGSER
jgi:L-cysteine/cystine lyase